MAKPEGFAGDGQRSGDLVLADWRRPILLVGCGNMAGAILARWLDCGLPVDRVTVVDPARGEIAPGLTARDALPDSIASHAIVMLGVKPQMLAAVAGPLNNALGEGTIILSMLAGVPLARLAQAFPKASDICRFMPNLAARWGKGVVLLASLARTNEMQSVDLLSPLGWLNPMSEADFDLGTALSGCGPAFVYRFVDALTQAAVAVGLPDDLTTAALAHQTVVGAVDLAARAWPVSPSDLADAVASPGGMTREGLDVLDRDGALVALLTETLRAAARRGEELARLSA